MFCMPGVPSSKRTGAGGAARRNRQPERHKEHHRRDEQRKTPAPSRPSARNKAQDAPRDGRQKDDRAQQPGQHDVAVAEVEGPAVDAVQATGQRADKEDIIRFQYRLINTNNPTVPAAIQSTYCRTLPALQAAQPQPQRVGPPRPGNSPKRSTNTRSIQSSSRAIRSTARAEPSARQSMPLAVDGRDPAGQPQHRPHEENGIQFVEPPLVDEER